MKKVALYVRVSCADQHVESQLYDLRKLAAQRSFEVVHEYEDRGISGNRARRPGLDALMADARRGRFSVILVAAFDRIARSTKNFLEIVDELNNLGIEFISASEAIDTTGAMGRLFITLIGSIAELERSLISERIRAGMRRSRADGVRLGRAPLQVNRAALLRDRQRGMSLNQVARAHKISKASVCRVLREEKAAVSRSHLPTDSIFSDNNQVALPISLV